MVLKRISPQLWSGLCRETDRHLPSASWMISPDLLPTQCPAHHLPAALSACLSPPLTESHRPPRPTSRRCTERQSHGSLPSSVGTHSWAQPWKPGGSQIPALRPTSSSSPAVIWQLVCSPSAHHLCIGSQFQAIATPPLCIFFMELRTGGLELRTADLCGASTAGLPSSSVAMVGVSLDSASEARWPVGSTMAPSSLLSNVARQSTSSIGLPHPSGSALV